jgi:hypothetical protein
VNTTLPARFSPSRQYGILFHAALLVVMLAGGGISLYLASQQPAQTKFILLALLSLALLTPIPLVLYRGYALLQARYVLERDGLRLRWGLRAEDIPLPDVEWIRPANEMGYSLPLPLLHWPGSIYGTRNVEGLGPVEYIASEKRNLLLIATPQKVYAISPEDLRAFLNTFQRTAEMGSLSPLRSYSVRPVMFLKQVWNDRLIRYTAVSNLVLIALLFVAASMLISIRPELPLGYDIEGLPLEAGPSIRILLLPILASITYVLSTTLGLFFYRQVHSRPVAYMLFTGSLVTPVLLFIATFMML